MHIQKNIKLVGSLGEENVEVLFNSDATYSCISPQLAKKLEVPIPLLKPLEFGTAEEARKVVAKERVSLDFYIDNYRFSDEFMVVENLSEGVIY